MGYGIVYLGSLRNDVARVKEILDLPEYAFPLFGMVVGEPTDDENGAPKPRLPFEHVFHKNAYNSNAKEQREAIQKYDEEISEYYKERTNGKRQETWSQQVLGFLSGKTRLDMLEELNKSGLMKK